MARIFLCLGLLALHMPQASAQAGRKKDADIDLADMQRRATKLVEEKGVRIEEAKFKPDMTRNQVFITPPKVLLGKDDDDNINATFRFLLTVEAIKNAPLPDVPTAKWTAAVSKAGALTSEEFQSIVQASPADAQKVLRTKLSNVNEAYVHFAKAQGQTAKFAYAVATYTVDFVTDPNDAVIHMISVWQFEVEALRGGDPEDLLRRSVVAMRQQNMQYAGDVYYKLERNGVLENQRKQITIDKSGTLTLP